MAAETWLEIAEAARILGLHPSTLRRWADEGKVPHRRTMTGRRRFERAAIDQVLAEMKPSHPQTSPVRIEPNTLEITRMHAADLSNLRKGWLSHLSDEQTLIFHYSGQRLLGLLMQYISRSDNAETFLDEAKRIAADYGKILSKIGLSTAQTAEAFLFFRRSILASVQSTAGLGGRHDQDGQRIFLKTSDFFDALLVATIQSHDQSDPMQT